METSKARVLLSVSLALVVVGDLGAFWVKTAGGTVSVVGLKLPTENGQWITADLFKPRIASPQHRVPVVVVCPGFERSKETMDSYSIELARRGMAVITIDPYGQGASSASRDRRSTTVEGNGVVPVVEYLSGTPNLNYIDKSAIGAAGYSAGANAVLQSTSRFGGLKRRSQASPANRISAVFIGGYVLSLTDDVLAPVRANLGMDYALYDEGSFRNANGSASMRNAPEALRLVNTIFTENRVPAVEIGRMYGVQEERTLRVVYNTRNIHPLLPYDSAHIANMTGFFAAAFHLQPKIPPSSQIWQYKEIFTLMALVGALLLPIPLAWMLLRLPLFQPLAHPVPPPLPAAGKSAKALFWITFLVSALVACFLFIPLARFTAVLFPAASTRVPTWWFPQRINNAILLWAVANGSFGLIVFFLTYKLHGKKHGVTPDMWGIRTTAAELARTLFLALSIFGSVYALLFASYGILHTDFRFTFVSAPAAFPVRILLVALEYIPLIFIFYLGNSIRVNCTIRLQSQKEWLTGLIDALCNSVGLILIVAIQYASLAFTGTVHWKEEWLYVNLLLGVIPMMFILPYYHKYFFNLTGRPYLGPMITCLIFVMMMLTSNVCYLPVD